MSNVNGMSNVCATCSPEESAFQRFFRSTPDLMIVVDFQGMIQTLNPALEKLMGWSSKELCGKWIRDYLPLHDGVYLHYAFEQCVQRQETSLKTELRLICRDQQLRYVDWSLVMLPTEQRVYGVGRDVTEQDLTEVTLLRSEMRLRAVLSHAPLIVSVLDRDGYFLLSEGRGLARLGLKPGEVVGKSAFELYQTFPETIAALRDALEGRPRNWTARVQDSFFDCRVTLLRNHKGEIEGLIGISTDITDLMAAQTTLENLFLGTASVTGQDFFIALVQYLAIALGVQYAMINDLQDDRFYTLALWAKGEIQSNIDFEVASAPGCAKVLKSKDCLYVAQMGEERNCPLLKPLEVNTYLGAPLTNPKGDVVGTLCVLNDRPLANVEQAQRILKIFAARAGSELNRLRVEQALENLNQELEERVQKQTQLWRQSQLQFERLVQNVPGAVYKATVHPDRSIEFLYISDHIIDLLGLNPQAIEADAQEILSRIHSADLASFEHSVARSITTTDRWSWDGRFLHQDGTYRYLRGNAQIAELIGEKPVQVQSWYGILIDIIDRK